jgi:hypothetical protein
MGTIKECRIYDREHLQSKEIIKGAMNMKPKSKTDSKSIEARLNDYPELRAKIERLLSVVENAEGDLIKADEAEQKVVEEIRQLGQTALQTWAMRQEAEQSAAYIAANPSSHRGGKKNFIGTAATEPLR